MATNESAAVERLALFPLNLVLFPGGLLPLRIFEPRYQRMVSECLRHEEPFVVAAITDGGAEAGGVASTASSGTLARIIDWEQLDDGLLGLLCDGGERVLLGRVETEPDQLLRVEVVRQPIPAVQSLPADLAWTGTLLDRLLQRIGDPFDRLRDVEPSADHVAGRLIELMPLPVAEKQALFEVDDAVERLRRLAALIQPKEGSTAN